MAETFGQRLRRFRNAAGISQLELAERVHADQSAVSRWENDRTTPSETVLEQLDQLLETGGELARLAFPVTAATLLPQDEQVTDDHVDELRSCIANLVALDGRHGGVELVPMAERVFRTASRRLTAGRCPSRLEPDFAATVAELGEVAGWLAFDATRFERARAINLEALHHARLAGDSSMELFLLGNMAMQAQESGQAQEALRIVGLMERFRLSPRLRIMVALRRARAAADLGDERSFRLIQRAKRAVDDSVQDSDPEWAWWVDLRELRMHEGGMWRAVGRPERAVDCYADALDAVPTDYRWAAYVGGATLLAALVEARAWREAETAAERVVGLAPDVSSGRASRRLRDAATTARRNRAPSSLEGMLTALATV